MEHARTQNLVPQDWIKAAMQIVRDEGVNGVRITKIAKVLGVTSGSFYWHFNKLQDLIDSMLDFWEQDLTDDIFAEIPDYHSHPKQRILDVMANVIESDTGEIDHAIATWAKSDSDIFERHHRTLKTRMERAAQLFEDAGFDPAQAASRARMMTRCLLGEAAPT